MALYVVTLFFGLFQMSSVFSTVVEPGIFHDCMDAYLNTCDKTSGPYNIRTTTTEGFTEIYCRMEENVPNGCPGYGWTPVLHVPENVTLAYESEYWTGNTGVNLAGGATFNTVNQLTVLPTLWSTKFDEICIDNVSEGAAGLFCAGVSGTLRNVFTRGSSFCSGDVNDAALCGGASSFTVAASIGLNIDDSVKCRIGATEGDLSLCLGGSATGLHFADTYRAISRSHGASIYVRKGIGRRK